jgi:hypothetical protein
MTSAARNLFPDLTRFPPANRFLLHSKNAIPQQTVDGLQGALEIRARSSYVPNSPDWRPIPASGDARLNAARSTRLECRYG